MCKFYCSKCDRINDIKSIRYKNNCAHCGRKSAMKYQCMRCNRHFISYIGVMNHVSIKGRCTSQRRYLNLHKFFDKWEKLNCPKCNVSFENISQFAKHVNNCEEEPKFWCSLCDFGTKGIVRFEGHMKLHDSRDKQSKSSFHMDQSKETEPSREKLGKLMSYIRS